MKCDPNPGDISLHFKYLISNCELFRSEDDWDMCKSAIHLTKAICVTMYSLFFTKLFVNSFGIKMLL